MMIYIFKKAEILSLLVTGFIFLCFIPADATILPYHTRITTPSPSGPFIHTGTNATSADVKVLQPWTGAFKDVSVTDRITFGVDHSNMNFVTLAGEVKVKLILEQWYVNNTSSTPDLTTHPELTIDYEPFGNTAPYIDKSVFTFNKAYKYKITIDVITQKGLVISTLPINLFIDADIMVERYYDFSVNSLQPISVNAPTSGDILDLNCDGIFDELILSWLPQIGAEDYHLEWTFINDYGVSIGPPYKSASLLDFDFKNNSTRIATTSTSHKITLTFEHGYLIYRVRGIGRNINNPNQPIVGVWSTPDKGKINTANSKYYNTQEHEGNKNWQYSATYAEEGKLKEVISYFDGGLRNRQSVTRVNSDNNTIVGQTIYDHQGRPAINVLPVPVQIPTCKNTNPLKFYPGFNMDSVNVNPYSRIDFDSDFSSLDSCTAKSGPMSTASGASNYYSPANPNKTGAQAFVPDGERYPFTQVEYTPDNTGRIRRQGGVGPKYQLGSNHETKYYYGTPNQIQLDRLFGPEVGDQAHYKKNVVVDANGQVSLSYLDQEGRTIATSLAGDAPKDSKGVTILAPLASESSAQKTLTIDLFSKNALGLSTVNVKDNHTNALVFNSQLLVAYKSEYEFKYNFDINPFTDLCLKDSNGINICFSCVYDLEIKVTDDCGRAVIPMTGSQPVFKTVGYFTTGTNGNIVSFKTDCNGPIPFSHSESFKLDLPIGNYMVSKILTVNSAAREFYVATYLDSNYNSCVKTLYDFQKEALANIDTSDCRLNCDSCVASLMKATGTKYTTVAEARDQYVAAGIGTELEFDYLMEECGAPCKNITWCEATYQQLLLDVSPDGQYAQFQNTVGGQTPDLTLSVLHVGNRLPKAFPPHSLYTDWQHPLINVNGSNYDHYLDEDGTRSAIHLIQDGANYIPPVDNPNSPYVKLDPVGNFYYTYPENLSDVNDFVANWKENWAKSLVQYHPEYCYYESCREYSISQPGNILTSDGFDSLLQVTNTYPDALLAGLVAQSYTTTIPNDIKLMANFIYQPAINIDPFLFSGSAFTNNGNTLKGIATNFKNLGGTNYSMVEIAANTARCGTSYGTPLNASPCKNFGQLGVDPDILDQEWNLLKNFYLSEKRKLQQELADANAGGGPCFSYNGCIGDSNYNPYLSGMINPGTSGSFWNSQFFNPHQPCSFFYLHLYIKKTKRFISPVDIHSPGPDDMDYQMYMQTGQCPLAIQYQYLLSGLAAKGHLDNTSGEDLHKHAEFTPGLYKEINGGIVSGIFTPYSWKAGSIAGNILTGNIVNNINTPVCSFVLDKSGTAIINWDDILSISELTYTNTTGANYEFKATAAFIGAGGSTKHEIITGSTCIRITGCTFATQNTTSNLTKDLGTLVSALQVNQVLTSPSAIDLVSGTQNYQPFLTTSIKSALGIPNSDLRWKFNGNQYELFDLNNSTKKLVIKFLNFIPGIFNNLNITSVNTFSSITSTSQNFFTMNGMNASGTSIVAIKGSIELLQGSVYTPINTGSISLPVPIACQGPEYQLREDLEALLKDVLLKRPFNSSINLFESPYLSALIQSYFPRHVTATGSFNPNQAIGGNYRDTLIFPIASEEGSCEMVLYHNGKKPARFFKDLVGFASPLIPYEPTVYGAYKFYIVGIYTVKGKTIQDTIWGYSCLPLKYCDPCPKGPKPNCVTCKSLTIIPPDTICMNQPVIFKFETDSCSGIPELLWDFGDSTTSVLATHTFVRAGNYQVTLFMIRPPECPDLLTSYSTISITVTNCGEPTQEDSVSWVWIDIDTSSFITEECENYYQKYTETYRKFEKEQQNRNACPEYKVVSPFYSYEDFVEGGLCNSAEGKELFRKYIQYFKSVPPCPGPMPKLTVPEPTVLQPLPQDSCKRAYEMYLAGIAHYNEFANSHPELGLIVIDHIYSFSDFISKKLCACAEAYVAHIGSLLTENEETDKDRLEEFLLLDITLMCPKFVNPPCDPPITQDTFISRSYIPYTNPCVQYQIDLAYVNAANSYQQYIDSLTTWIAAKYNEHCLSAFESFSAVYKDKEYHFTLYYYDQAGNLVRTIPPEGVDIIDMPDTLDADYIQIQKDRTYGRHTFFTNHTMATTYVYNSLNQLVNQSMPDHDMMNIWEYTLPSGLDSRLHVTGTQFVNSTKGYLSGYIDAGIVTSANKRGYLYTTDNGGVTWTQMNDLVASDLKKIQMIDGLNGFAVGNHGIVLKTTNGGASWDLISLAGIKITTILNDLFFTSTSNGVIVGDTDFIMITKDAGISFTAISSTVFSGMKIKAVTYDGSDLYFAGVDVIGHGKLFKGSVTNATTSAITISWSASSSIRSTDLEKIQMVDASKGFAIGVDGTLLKTTNNGNIWISIPTGIKDNFKDVYFKDMTMGVAIIDSFPGYGLIYKTTDGGESWTLLSNHGEYYNHFHFYLLDKGYAVGDLHKMKRVVLAGNVGLVNIPVSVTSSTFNINGCHFFSADRGWIVGNSDTLYYTTNATASYPSWTLVKTGLTGSNADFNEIIFNDPNQNTGILLGANGKLYKITSNPANGTTYSFTQISTSSENFIDIDESGGLTGEIYAYDKAATTSAGTPLKYVNKAFIASSTALSTVSISGAVPILTNVKSIFAKNTNTVFLAGSNGDIFRGNIINTSTVAWTEQSLATIPLPLRDIQAAGSQNIFAVGAEGTLLQTTNGTDWKTLPSATITDFNAIKFNTNPITTSPSGYNGLIAGDNGMLLKSVVTSGTVALSSVSLSTQEDLNDIALNTSNKAYIAGAHGTLISISDIQNTTPSMALLKPVEDFHGLCFIPSASSSSQVIVVGDNSAVYQYNGTTGSKIKGVFTPALSDVHFINVQNGYIVGDSGTIRHTMDGGLKWQYILAKNSSGGTAIPPPMLNGVWTTQPNRAVIIGDNGYKANIAGPTGNALNYNSSFSTGKDLQAIAFHQDTGYIVGANGAAYTSSNYGTTWSVLPNSGGITTNLKAIHIFQNNDFMAVGDQKKIYCYNGAWVKHDPPSTVNGITIFNDVFFHDDRTGYVVGSAGPGTASYVLRCSFPKNIQLSPTTTTSWIPMPLDGINGTTNASALDITTIDFATRYHGFLGGSFNSGTQINYARLVNDETNMFSTRFIYDMLGRMVVSQNTKQFNRGENTIPKGLADYSYTLYDDLGRISEVGEVSDNAGATTNFSTIFGEYVGQQFNPNVINDAKLNIWIKASTRREVTKTYYDTIAINGLPIMQENLRKRVASVTFEEKFDDEDQTFDHGTHYSYDIHGNVDTLLQDNQKLLYLGVASGSPAIQAQRFKQIDYEYDLISGKVNLVRFQDGQPDAFYHFYRYNADNRITDVYTSKYSQQNTFINQDVVLHHPLWDLDAHYDYYLHGPLERVEYGSVDNKVQGTDYVYTLQDWIKGVNSNLLKSENDVGQDGLPGGVHSKVAKDAFSYTLNYHAGDYKPIDANKWNTVAYRFESISTSSDLRDARFDLYNGNISSMVTTIEEPKAYTGAPNEMPNIWPQGTAYKYDQLNRLLEMKAFQNLGNDPTDPLTYNYWKQGSTYTGLYHNTFEYDANGNILKQLRADATGTIIDSLSYKYLKDATGRKSSNRLYHVDDNVIKTAFTDDIDDQGNFNSSPITANLILNNYLYDEIGNLKRDTQEEIKNIDWTVYGKIKSITRYSTSLKSDLEFNYDASGNRIAKIEMPRDVNGVKPKSDWITTYYARDAQGNVMGIYKKSPGTSALDFKLIELNLWGSSRFGSNNTLIDLLTNSSPDTNRVLGNKHFEGSNHLGNVLSVFSDRQIPQNKNSDALIDYFQSDVLSVNDYSPFGVVLEGREFGNSIRYGFNGKENDNEVKGIGYQQEYGMRIYDPRIGKFLSIDPLTRKYPELTTYQFASNTPIQAIDLDGLEAVKIDLTTRATVVFVSVAIGISIVAAPDGIAFFLSPEVGFGTGVSVAAGVGVSYFPAVKEASQLGGWGVNAGASVMGNGGDFNVSIQQDKNGTPNDVKLGGTASVPRLGGGAGAEAHLTGSYSFQLGETITWKEMYKQATAIAEDLGISENELMKLVDQAKNEQQKLAQQQQEKPAVPKNQSAPKKINNSQTNTNNKSATSKPVAKVTAKPKEQVKKTKVQGG